MCEWAEVSRSGYYNWINNTRINRARKHAQDTEDYALIKDGRRQRCTYDSYAASSMGVFDEP